MKRGFPVLALLLASAVNVVGAADVPKLSAGERALLLDTKRFQPVTSFTALPASVRDVCVGHDGRVADPGEPFNAGCVIGPDSPPSVRMDWASYSPADHVYVLHFERGGIAHMFYVVVLRESDGSAAIEWAGSSKPPQQLENDAAFVEALKANALTDSRWR